jgi:hypothetical protein
MDKIYDVWLLSYEGKDQQEIHLDLSTIMQRITDLRSDGYLEADSYLITVELKTLYRDD